MQLSVLVFVAMTLAMTKATDRKDWARGKPMSPFGDFNKEEECFNENPQNFQLRVMSTPQPPRLQ
jgi:hypothetical protein